MSASVSTLPFGAEVCFCSFKHSHSCICYSKDKESKNPTLKACMKF